MVDIVEWLILRPFRAWMGTYVTMGSAHRCGIAPFQGLLLLAAAYWSILTEAEASLTNLEAKALLPSLVGFQQLFKEN
jgi:hypothetical protein